MAFRELRIAYDTIALCRFVQGWIALDWIGLDWTRLDSHTAYTSVSFVIALDTTTAP